VIVRPNTQQEYTAMANFLHHYAHVNPTMDLQLFGWVTEDKLRIVVGLNGFLGKVCQMHLAMEPGHEYSPKIMLKSVFEATFGEYGREQVLGIVNSLNGKAMRYDTHLGFEEVLRLPGMHDDGGDVVVLSLKKENCKYLKELAA
jgi:hypothetical protein